MHPDDRILSARSRQQTHESEADQEGTAQEKRRASAREALHLPDHLTDIVSLDLVADGVDLVGGALRQPRRRIAPRSCRVDDALPNASAMS
ncbi:MAG: hypothetical protein HWD60_13480 [Defluviicoccus sp.]|nr:MAG: hypothetical protein HWD60_13480 [Defluviicoccus sp.]